MRSPGDREQALVPALHGAGFSSKQPWDSDELDHEFGRPYKARCAAVMGLRPSLCNPGGFPVRLLCCPLSAESAAA